MHQANARNAKIKRVCRLVILPDYQGIGLGTKLLNVIAEHYTALGFDFSIVTSARNMIFALNSNSNWVLQRYSSSKLQASVSHKALLNSIRNKCKTASFFYVKRK